MGFQLAEMVNLHFLSLLEALLEVNASILGKLMPLWTPVLFAHYMQVKSRNFIRRFITQDSTLQLKWHYISATWTSSGSIAKLPKFPTSITN